ncbi:hypothetical protein AGRA3207_007670 [Actinomadura graeca]|uniref:Uncharacterized protein n=1 Tax=Actinomadura graeca TaxID=2750812 RepID=A0ABX8R4V4_9ACTN|nr:hypothetical protein [Actinomadura graeca]QXJ26075.1 hypothetical protein AGRA3207_007670 [Actinomadura graeca]
MAQTDLSMLDDLGRALTGRGFLTMIVTGPRARLEVLDRASRGRTGTVLCERDARGDRWYYWSWADRIAPAAEVERAAAAVEHDLRRVTWAA